MPTRVYVGNLVPDVRESELERLFRDMPIREILIKPHGFAFVEFRDERDADDAVRSFDRSEFLGKRIFVEFAREPGSRRRDRSPEYRRERSPEYRRDRSRDRHDSRYDRHDRYERSSRTKYRLKIENLPRDVDWKDLKDHFREAAEVTYADVSRDRDDQGVVDFATYEDMKAALEKMNGKELRGNALRLFEEETRREGEESRPRQRSRSPARSDRS